MRRFVARQGNEKGRGSFLPKEKADANYEAVYSPEQKHSCVSAPG